MSDDASVDVKQTKITHTWEYSAPLTACRFSPDGQFLVSAALDGKLQRWHLESGNVTPLEGHTSWIRGIGFSADSQQLITAGYDGRLLFWPLQDKTPRPSRDIKAHDGWIRALAVSPNLAVLATCGNDQVVKLWSLDDGHLLHTFNGHQSHVYSVAFHPTEAALVSGDLLGQVLQWDLQTAKPSRTIDVADLHTYHAGQGAHYGGVRSMAFCPDHRSLACSGLHKATNPYAGVQQPLVIIVDWQTGKAIRSHVTQGIERGIAWRVVFHSRDLLLAASGGGSGGYLLFWQGDGEQTMHQVKLPNTTFDLDVHPDQRQLATVHHDQRVRISTL